MARLGEICTIKASNHTSSIDRNWLLNLDAVEQQTGKVLEYNYVTESALDGSIVGFDTNNVLYSKLRPNLNKVVVPQFEGYATSEMLPLYPDTSKITREYLAFYLRSPAFVQWAISKTAGAKMPRLGTKELLSKDIPLPTLGEQNDIVMLFDRINALISLQKKQLQKLDDLAKSRFIEMFGTLSLPAPGCDVLTIQDVCEPIKDGTHQTPEYTDDKDKGYLFLSSKDVNTGYIDWSHPKYIPEYLHRELYSRIAPHKGDILLAKNGTTGIAAIVDRDEVFDIYVSLAWLRPKGIDPVFLWAAINNEETKKQFDSSLKGIGVPNLHLGEIKKTKILVGSHECQQKFSSFVSTVNKTKLTVQQSLDKLEMLKQSLMQKYFG